MSKVSSKVHTRLTMPGQIHKAYKVMLKLIHPKFVSQDKKIPLRILKNAKGIAFVTVVKAGFVWSGTLGSGIVIAKLPDGTWSGPSSIGVGGMGWGALIGASVTDSVIVLNTDLAVKAFAGHGQVKFGGSLSIAAGPVGREGDGSAYVGDGGVAACYSYSHSRGLFAGISLQGAIFMTRDADNAKFYGYPVKSWDILKGKAVAPEFPDLKKLYEVLDVVNKSETDEYNFRDPKMQSFKDSSGVSFHATPGAAYQSHRFDDPDDDDDDLPVATASGGSGFAWGTDPQQQDEDDIAFAKAFAATTIAEKSEELAPGWVKVSPEGGGQPYFWHEPSGKTQWEVPVKIAAAAAPPPPPPPPAKVDPDALPPGWVKLVAGDGQPYYWNESLNVTQWDKPVAASKPVPVSAPTPTVPPRRTSSAATTATTARGAAPTAPNPVTQQSSFRTPSNPAMQQAAVRAASNPSAQQAAFSASGANPAMQQTAARAATNPLAQQAAMRAASNPAMQQAAFNAAAASVSTSAPARPAVPTNRPAIPNRQPSAKGASSASNPFDAM